MKRPKLVINNIYHIYNRGVEKRKIFLDNDDYFRFIHNLFEFNDVQPASNLYYKSYEMRSHKIEKRTPRHLLVKILAFCLMPNHFHLLLEPIQENGISFFLKKLGIGYAMYFNQKYSRTGTLFQGRFKRVLVDKEPYFIHLPFYIHLNPIELVEPEWKEQKIKNYSRAIKFLESYRWSSYLDYIGIKNFPSVTQREFLTEFFNGPQEYKKETIKWLQELDINALQEVKID